MQKWQFGLACGLGGLVVAQVIVFMVVVNGNMNRETALRAQQEDINRGMMAQRIGNDLIRDMGNIALTNAKMKALLATHGFTVNANK